jgi:mono/diheme cytochrome c family protein
MIRPPLAVAFCMTLLVGCSQQRKVQGNTHPAPAGATLTVSSGDKQVGTIGAWLDDPLVIQANDAQGNGLPGVQVRFEAADGVRFDPEAGATDASGQLSAQVALGDFAGRYKIRAIASDASGKPLEAAMDAVALGYEQALGRELEHHYCARCHNSESTPERVSNYDNLVAKPHAFTDGDTFNKLSDGDIELIIGHGGGALNRSAEMPAYGYTLTKSELRALIAYIRAVSDPPYRTTGVVYAGH